MKFIKVLKDQLLDIVSKFGGEGDGLVLLLDQLLDSFIGHCLALTIGDLSGPTGADEI
ncbi:hypothetical protein [Ferrimicrobium sp.]|uniref:hypothetical protein n=1 Tax=Ferrimicrobium sp. TaxID=2926050 RepID=UPI0026096999|nr:hypothetical protein [Ferrimicrobium sp.]